MHFTTISSKACSQPVTRGWIAVVCCATSPGSECIVAKTPCNSHRNSSDHWSIVEQSSAKVTLIFWPILALEAGDRNVKEDTCALRLLRDEAEVSRVCLVKKKKKKDDFNKIAVSDAGALRAGSARCGLFGFRPPRVHAGSPARQAEKTSWFSSRSISHPCDRQHFFFSHRAARLSQEAEWSSWTGNALTRTLWI